MAEPNQKICKCGCGEITKGGDFAPGHDQKLRSAIERELGGLERLKQIAEAILDREIKGA